MARRHDPYRLSSPQIFLWRMGIFLILSGFVAAIMFPQLREAFMSNPGLNGVILMVLAFGILLALRQVIRLFGEIGWVNSFRLHDPALAMRRPPVLLAPMASMLGERPDRLSPEVVRALLDSIGTRLDEGRDILRYMMGLLVFLGLLGTFWGLQETVGSVGRIIKSLEVGKGDFGVLFEDLKTGLAAPLGGMGVAFSSSLFGLAGSLVLGFLDLQASQAQNRFYTELEDWLASVTDVGEAAGPAPSLDLTELKASIDRLARVMAEGAPASAGSSRSATAAMADLAEGVQGLIQHMRAEQQMLRQWVEAQTERQKDVHRLIEAVARDTHDARDARVNIR
ncbi:MAG: flagellar motor protein MotA [Pseudomonadota bacterium]|nr:flagellar motor protein MotA [Pseudomonadota bacterium]